uniref:UNC-50 family protein n=1 Tax=Hirondellea gigas TaxID=1518452 RepID=A0A6A7G866_9CRUS
MIPVSPSTSPAAFHTREYVAPITPVEPRQGDLHRYFVRVFHSTHMDFQSAFSLMMNLCRSPKTVYQTTECRKDIKNQWARDDPAFLVILVGLNILSNIIYSLSFGVRSFGHFVMIIFYSIVFDFFLVGILIASIGWSIANRHFGQSVVRNDSQMEWQYAFDIHCNAYFPFFLLTNVVQYIFYPILWRENMVSVFLSNFLYAFAFSYYCYITFLGYDILQLQHTERCVYPVSVIVIVFAMSFLMGCNPTRFVVEAYFGRQH